MPEQLNTIGREIKVSGAAIAGIVSCVPGNEIQNNYFIDRLGENVVNDVVKMIGVQKRHWIDDALSTRDLCCAAGKQLLTGLGWPPDSVDVLIFVSQTPDYRLPATACALQADLGLSKNTIAFDVNLGCSGYPYAIWLGMTLIQSGAAKRVLLAVGDTISKIVDKGDRSTALLFGDAGTMTAIESTSDQDAFFVLGTDGAGMNNLIVPSGSFRDYPVCDDARMAGKDPECLFMDGSEVFNFTLSSVPKLFERLIEFSQKPLATYDYLLFHQANLFMLKHLAKKLKIPNEKMPINIEEYGNTSCASIPLLMTTRLKEELLKGRCKVAMFGFGVGYSWGAASLDIGPIQYIETIEI